MTKEEDQNIKRKFSAFQITCFVLIAIFVLAIIIQIPILVHYRNKIRDTKRENDELPQVTEQVLVDENHDFYL